MNTSETKNLLKDLRLEKSLKTPAASNSLKWIVSAVLGVTVIGVGVVFNSFASSPTDSTKPATAQVPASQVVGAQAAGKADNSATNPAPAAATTPVAATDTVNVNASGYVLAEKSATVSSDTTGRLKEILVEEGEQVVKGQLLATIDQRVAEAELQLTKVQLETARSTYQQTLIRLDEAKRKHQRIQHLAKKQFVSEEQLDDSHYSFSILEAELATNASNIKVAEQRLFIQQQLLENAKIYAPFSGIVTELAAEVGEIVSPISAGGGFTRTGICTIIDIAALKVEVQVSEQYIEKVHLGQVVNVNSIAYPNVKISGVVSSIMPQANRETASITVKINLLTKDKNIVPNMRVDVAFLDKRSIQISQNQTPTELNNAPAIN